MQTKPLRTGAVCNVTHIVFPRTDPVIVIFESSGDKLGSVSFVLSMNVIPILEAALCIWEIFQQLSYDFFLRNAYGKVFPGVIDLINIISLGNIFDEILGMIFHPRL